MTGLFDKITAENKFRRKYLVEGGTGVLLIFDIDNFKKVNDCCGHSKGDDILGMWERSFVCSAVRMILRGG